MKFITAREAKRLTKQSIDNGNNEELSKLFNSISDAIKEGKYKIDYYGMLSDEAKNYIKLLEYNVNYVQCSMNEYCWRITWI